jgi:hypothetical protein
MLPLLLPLLLLLPLARARPEARLSHDALLRWGGLERGRKLVCKIVFGKFYSERGWKDHNQTPSSNLDV